MAWSAPSEWERWDPDKLLVCPYNQLHMIPAKRYQYHVIKCRENYPEKDFVSCPFNAKHIMLRPELRRHITRCQDRGEIEPYTFKGNEKDSEGFYFKGDTSVPCYRREAVLRPLEEDWDRDDEETTSQQNLCEYYASRASLPATRQGIQDVHVLSLNPTDREDFKRNIRTQALQSQHHQQNQESLTEQEQLVDSSSTELENYYGGQTCGQERDGNFYLRERTEYVSGRPNTSSLSQNQWFWSSSNNHYRNGTSIRGQPVNFNSDDNKIRLLNQGLEKESPTNSWIPGNSDTNNYGSRVYGDGFSAEPKPQRVNHYTGTANSHQNNGDVNTGLGNNEHEFGGTMSEMRGFNTGAERPSLRGAGRAKLAEEARRMNFGFKRNGTHVGRGRGILDLFSSSEQE